MTSFISLMVVAHYHLPVFSASPLTFISTQQAQSSKQIKAGLRPFNTLSHLGISSASHVPDIDSGSSEKEPPSYITMTCVNLKGFLQIQC